MAVEKQFLPISLQIEVHGFYLSESTELNIDVLKFRFTYTSGFNYVDWFNSPKAR